jgi:hypothetical protein
VERPEPARDRRARPLRARLRAHPRVDGNARAADQLPSLPLRPRALHAQRLDRPLPRREARLMLAVDPRLCGSRLDRFGGVLLPRPHARARGRPAALAPSAHRARAKPASGRSR